MKKLFLIICFLVAIFIFAKSSPALADARCGAGLVCWPETESDMVWYTGCKFYSGSGTDEGNYCAGDGYTGDSCSCDGSPNCTCTVSSDPGEGERCGLTEESIETCLCQKGGQVCRSNSECRLNFGGAYPKDICGCNTSSQGCELKPGTKTWGCCYGETSPIPTSGPAPTSGPTSTPTTGPTTEPTRQLQVTVNFYRSSNATYNPASNNCSHTSASNYSDGVFLQSKLKNDPSLNHGLIASHTYNFNLDHVITGDPFTLTANTQNFEYTCTCPAGCSYALEVPSGNTLTRNFYFDNYSDAWFQVFGTNIFSGNSLKSIVPNNNSCTLPNCQAAVFVPQPTGNNLSSGFPLLSTTSSNSIQTHRDPNSHLANIHLLGQRASNQSSDGFALGFSAQGLSFDYFKQMANNIGQTIHTQTPAQANLASWRSNGWLPTAQTSFFEVNGDLIIDQSKSFAVNHGEKAIVFVNGDLTINNTGASGAKVISVARKTSANIGGFLAFFTTGDIIIRSNVGTTLNPATLNNPTVSFSSAHLEGVFFSDQKIIVNGREQDGAIANYPDRKLIAAGTFIGLEGVELNRQSEDGTPAMESYKALNNIQALENFIYRPDLLINWPDELKTSVVNWRELAPRSFDN